MKQRFPPDWPLAGAGLPAVFKQLAKAHSLQKARDDLGQYLRDHADDRVAHRLLRRLPRWRPGTPKPRLRGGGGVIIVCAILMRIVFKVFLKCFLKCFAVVMLL